MTTNILRLGKRKVLLSVLIVAAIMLIPAAASADSEPAAEAPVESCSAGVECTGAQDSGSGGSDSGVADSSAGSGGGGSYSADTGSGGSSSAYDGGGSSRTAEKKEAFDSAKDSGGSTGGSSTGSTGSAGSSDSGSTSAPASGSAASDGDKATDSTPKDSEAPASGSDQTSTGAAPETSGSDEIVSLDYFDSDDSKDKESRSFPDDKTADQPSSGEEQSSQDEGGEAGEPDEGEAADAADASDEADGAEPEGTDESGEADEEEAAGGAADDEGTTVSGGSGEGNSYVATVTPNGIVGLGHETEFAITFKELGDDDRIGSAKITFLQGANNDLDWKYYPANDITAPEGKLWDSSFLIFDPVNHFYYIDLWAKNADSYIVKDDGGLTVTFRGTRNFITSGGNDLGFKTEAWLDAEGIDPDTGVGSGTGIDNNRKNNPASIYGAGNYGTGSHHEELWVGVDETIGGTLNKWAVTANQSGSTTVVVHPGEYEENVVINQDNLTLKSVSGRDDTIIDAGGATNGIEIGSQTWDENITYPTGVTVEGFTVKGWTERGISQRNGTGTLFIRDNLLLGPDIGSRNGINISGGTGSEITGNIIRTSSFDQENWSGTGILLMGAHNTLVDGNEVIGADLGIVVAGYPDWENHDPSWTEASGNMISNNYVSGRSSGIALAGAAFDTEITGNTITGNNRGVNEYPQLGGVPKGTFLEDNTFSGNGWGIRISSALESNPSYTIPMNITNNSFDNSGTFHIRDFSNRQTVADLADNNNFDKSVYIEGVPHIAVRIQPMIDSADPGDTILVGPGTYEEFLVVDKSVALLGPNAGIAGYSANRGDEALIVPPADAYEVDPYSLIPDVIRVTAENVVIDGFKLEPLNPDADDAFIYQACNGIFGDANGLEVRNNIISGFPDMGVWVHRSHGEVRNINIGPITGVVVENNWIKESYDGYGFGFYIQGAIGHILNNTVEAVLANQIQPYDAVAAPDEGLVIGNTISARRIALWHNYDEKGGEWTYSGNTLTADPTATWWHGIRVQTVYDSPTLIFTNNTIDGAGVPGDDVVGFKFMGRVDEAACDNLDFSNNTFQGLVVFVEDDSNGKHVDLDAILAANTYIPGAIVDGYRIIRWEPEPDPVTDPDPDPDPVFTPLLFGAITAGDEPLWSPRGARPDDVPDTPAPPTPAELAIAPEAPLVSPGQFLVLPPADPATDPAPLVTVLFVNAGTSGELATVIDAYEFLQEDFDANWEELDDSEYALTLLDLAVAWAAIQAREAALTDEAGEEVNLDAAVEAYQAAMGYLADYGEFLTEEQLEALEEVLAAVAELLETLGAEL